MIIMSKINNNKIKNKLLKINNNKLITIKIIVLYHKICKITIIALKLVTSCVIKNNLQTNNQLIVIIF